MHDPNMWYCTFLTLTGKWKPVRSLKGLSASHLRLGPDSVAVNSDRAGRPLSGGMQRTLRQTGITTARMNENENEGGY